MRLNSRVCFILCLVLLSLSLAGAACSREEPVPSSTRSAPATRDTASGAPAAPQAALPPSAHDTDLTRDADALLLETGATLAQIQTILEPLVRRGTVRVERSASEARTLRDSTVNVTEQSLAVTGAAPVEHVRLVYFDGVLVSVIQTYRQPRAELAEALEAELGPALERDGWLGWWDPDADRIVQVREAGRVHEVFDLAAASTSVPEIRLAMLDSWVARYGAPPPWAFIER